jgi:FkbM family methyltransferase
MLARIKQVKEILDHPLNSPNRFSAFLRYLRWNIGRRLLDEADYAIRITPNAQVILSNRENYATLAYTCRLYDFEEMQFMLHYLRPGDVFGDFGSNVGVYSVLAGSVGANVLAVEPVPDTYTRLKRNLQLNSVGGQAVRCGLSNVKDVLRFTVDQGGMNRVATSRDSNTVEVDVRTVDEVVASTALSPRLIKIDVEGFELPLLQGAPELLKSVSGIIIELNGSGRIYGRSDEDVHNLLVAAGFKCFDYDVKARTLSASEGFRRDKFNSLYLRLGAVDEVRERLRTFADRG